MGRHSPTLIAVLCLLLAFFVSLQVEAATIATGSNHAVAIKSDGTLWAWGNNGSGQLGDGTFVSRTSPQQVLTGFTVVSAVISTVPEDGTTNVDVDARIKAAFSTEMDAATITTDTFDIQTPRSMGAHAQAPAPDGQITAPIHRAPYGLFPPGCRPLWA